MEKTGLAFTKKLDAAVRQLDTAIWLWFNEGDLVSVNTLAGAAHGILDDLLHHKKRERAWPFDQTPEGMKPREWRKIVKEAQSFAKHARIDPEDSYLYSVESTAYYLLYAVASHSRFTDFGEVTGLRGLFMLYFAIAHPDCFGSAALPHIAKSVNVEKAKKLSRIQFLRKISIDLQAGRLARLPTFHAPP